MKKRKPRGKVLFDWPKFTGDMNRAYNFGAANGCGMREMSKDVGVSPATFQRVISGRKCTVDAAAAFCQWVGVDMSQYVVREVLKPKRRKRGNTRRRPRP